MSFLKSLKRCLKSVKNVQPVKRPASVRPCIEALEERALMAGGLASAAGPDGCYFVSTLDESPYGSSSSVRTCADGTVEGLRREGKGQWYSKGHMVDGQYVADGPRRYLSVDTDASAFPSWMPKEQFVKQVEEGQRWVITGLWQGGVWQEGKTIRVEGTDEKDTITVERYDAVNGCEARNLVYGTTGNDDCSLEPSRIPFIKVQMNGGSAQYFNAKSAEKLVIDAGKGNDQVDVRGMNIDMDINLGGGNDRLKVEVDEKGPEQFFVFDAPRLRDEPVPARINVDAGHGDDVVRVSGQHARVDIDGGAGDDRLTHTGQGRAHITGGEGDDNVKGRTQNSSQARSDRDAVDAIFKQKKDRYRVIPF